MDGDNKTRTANFYECLSRGTNLGFTENLSQRNARGLQVAFKVDDRPVGRTRKTIVSLPHDKSTAGRESVQGRPGRQRQRIGLPGLAPGDIFLQVRGIASLLLDKVRPVDAPWIDIP